MKWERLLSAALCSWLGWLLWIARREMLDDALIHLRYAANFAQQHRISYDGVQSNYGTSSLLYVLLLAGLRSMCASPLLPKAVSLIGYVGLLIVFARLARHSALACATLLLLCGPYAVRWLTDGMETSLVCLLTVVFVIAIIRASPAIVLGLLALTISALRVDLTIVVAFGSLLLLVQRAWLRAAAAAAGSATSLLLIQWSMGRILPDTAVAKVVLNVSSVLLSVVHVIASTGSFGIGISGLWGVTAVMAWRRHAPIRRSVAIANLLFPAVVLLAAIEGQQMKAIRYLLWSLLFSLTWNLLVLRREPSSAAHTTSARAYRPWLAAFACVAAVSWAIELPRALQIFRGRAATLEAMEEAHLEQFHEREGLAGDVGYIGYFTRSPVCDLNGLINGRERAVMVYEQRMQVCMAEHPAYLFISSQQREYLESAALFQSDKEWIYCGSVDFPNAASDDRHFLFFRREVFPRGCPTHL